MRAVRRAIAWLTALAILGGAGLILWTMVRGRPQDMPWAPLDLGQPIGMFTGWKLAALTDDAPRCRALLDSAGVTYTTLPVRSDGPGCGYGDGIRLTAGGARRIALAPATVGMACPVAAALAMWEWDVVQPAAQTAFGSRVVRIDHFGSYNCRRTYGRDTGSWSEHATADAIDIAGFRLADGGRITVLGDWRSDDDGSDNRRAAFLRTVRDGACRVFATVLSPDYNAAHRDHFHLDQAERGALGGRACR